MIGLQVFFKLTLNLPELFALHNIADSTDSLDGAFAEFASCFAYDHIEQVRANVGVAFRESLVELLER